MVVNLSLKNYHERGASFPSDKFGDLDFAPIISTKQ